MKAPVIALALLAACATAGEPASINGVWMLDSVDGARLAPGTWARLELDDGQVGGGVFCNALGGTYRREGDRVTFENIEMTLLGCRQSDPLGHQAAFVRMLDRTARVATPEANVLRVTDRSHTFRFHRMTAEEGAR